MARRRRDPEGRMPLREHLGELRRRLLLALAGIAVGTAVGWFLYDPVLESVTAPLNVARAEGALAGLNFTTLGSAFDLRVQVSVVIGLFLTSPWWVGQLWLFLAPAMHRGEKVRAAAFALAGAALFLAGGAFAWFLVPHVVEILTSFVPEDGTSLVDARSYLVFVLRVLVVFGVAFLVPVVMVGLGAARLVSARTFLRGWRWAIIGAFVFAAFANPLPDAWSMIGMALPILVLYFGAIGICALLERARARRERTSAGPDAAVATPSTKDPA
ncbi:twin-arginine translocase subunit TatC [Georgenia sp. Z1344]|uniref:twin-arginine translocase subunit TatC n=1 Tax=Georgenia sp. Z1344 TaxID=3416706 RepID=UPI003CF64BC6